MIDRTHRTVISMTRPCSHPLCKAPATKTIVCVGSADEDDSQVMNLPVCDEHLEAGEHAVETAQRNFMGLSREVREKTRMVELVPDLGVAVVASRTHESKAR